MNHYATAEKNGVNIVLGFLYKEKMEQFITADPFLHNRRQISRETAAKHYDTAIFYEFWPPKIINLNTGKTT